jgi:hypothetical protein
MNTYQECGNVLIEGQGNYLNCGADYAEFRVKGNN